LTGDDSEFQTTRDNRLGSDSKKVYTKIADQPEAEQLKQMPLMNLDMAHSISRELTMGLKV